MITPAGASVFVAGHRGLIGSAFVRQLEKAGGARIIERTRSELELRDRLAVERFFQTERPDYVVLGAGRVGGIVENMTRPATFLEENLAVQLNVLSAARKAQTKRVLLFASSCMYPRLAEQPMAEELLLTGSPEPTSLPYAIAKLAGLHLCLSYNREDGGARFVPLIPNSVYGPNDNFDPQRGHVLSALVSRFHAARRANDESVTLWGTGAPQREFVHADDLARAGLALLDAKLENVALPLNVGSGAEISIRDLAMLVARIVGFEGRILWDTSRPDGAPRKLLDSRRVRALGWSPVVELEDGIADTYRWFTGNLAERTDG